MDLALHPQGAPCRELNLRYRCHSKKINLISIFFGSANALRVNHSADSGRSLLIRMQSCVLNKEACADQEDN
jgi:hypothetical protein